MAGAAGLVARIIEAAIAGDDLGQIVELVCDGLVAHGLPVLRAGLGMPALDPSVRAVNFVWERGRGVSLRETSHSGYAEAGFRDSPVPYLLERGEMSGRWRVDDPAVAAQFALFRELREQGATEFAVQLVGFGRRQMALEGTALSVATDRPHGFRPDDLAIIQEIVPALALAAYRVGLGNIVTRTMAAYLGERTALRVLRGTIQRGDGEAITAAVLLADLRGFTSLSEQHRSPAVVGWLNEHFDAMGEPIHERGGEILKFVGDGILAVFAADQAGETAATVCGDALHAAGEALRRTETLNQRRAAAGEPALGLTITLHYGELFYGNIGTAGRLDFTVIGRAVNEASRMEELCKRLDRNLLISETFAQNCLDRHTLASLGRHELRTLGSREVFTLAKS